MVFMAYNIKREHSRVCKYCGNTYSTNARHSRVCSNCYEKNHQRKVERTIFNGK
jgi:protein-arginine kinase activator protein McsA